MLVYKKIKSFTFKRLTVEMQKIMAENKYILLLNNKVISLEGSYDETNNEFNDLVRKLLD
jgi:hypothetical protein